MQKTSSEILQEAATLLEEEGRWIKASWLRKALNGKKGCSMCAHGAIAYCADRDLRNSLEEEGMTDAAISKAAAIASTGPFAWAQDANTYATSASKSSYNEEMQAATLAKIADNNRGWAHYAAMRNGLTVGFNDAPSTTKEQVIEKLRSAAKIAESEGK